jgi:hypothetical protein
MGPDHGLGLSLDDVPVVISPEANPTTTAAEEAAWRANVDAVQQAKARCVQRRREMADINAKGAATRREVMAAVAARGGRCPNADELARLDAATAADQAAVEAYQAALVDHQAALDRFKAGVTPEQVAAARDARTEPSEADQ